MSIFRGPCNATSSIIHSIHYIFLWTNWWYYNLCTAWIGGFIGNGRNLVEYESILASIEESYAENKSNHESISTESIEDIQYGKYVHLYINSIYTRLKIRKHIRQWKSGWKGAEPSEKIIGKVLHKVFEIVVKWLNSSLTVLGESGSEVSHFIPEHRNFS